MRKFLRSFLVLGAASAALVSVGVALWILAGMYLPPWLKYYDRYSKANAYIELVEKFKEENGYYPVEQNQNIVPRTEFKNPFFYRGGGENFELGFTAGFDEVYTYSSYDKKWHFE